MPFRFNALNAGLGIIAVLVSFAVALPTRALSPDTLQSVVSVLPVWPGQPQGGLGEGPLGTAPEGTGIVIAPGIVATAWHVIEPARRVDLRLADGRILPARPIAFDAATDIALLGVEVDLPVFPLHFEPAVALRVCALGNAYGLDISITCGVVSQLGVTNAGFNAIEDFIQTDVAVNPGMSGGALVDAEGRLLGMLSAIFAGAGDGNVGVNFAVSAALLDRVARALLVDGEIRYPVPGWQLAPARLRQRRLSAAPSVANVEEGGAAAAAGLLPGDRVVKIEGRLIRSPRDARTALALVDPARTDVTLEVLRDGQPLRLLLPIQLAGSTRGSAAAVPAQELDCPNPEPVCTLRQAVFPISSFDPVGSATRIGPDLLVTNRHMIADRTIATVHTPNGPLEAAVVPSAYPGDLALLRVSGLPEHGAIAALAESATDGPFFFIGADAAQQVVRVFAPGDKILDPAQGAALGRLHVSARMQPGVSGGALVDAEGRLAGIAVGGGDGRFQAIPISQIQRLLNGRGAASAALVQRTLGAAYADCQTRIESVGAAGRETPADERLALEEICLESANYGQLLDAGRVLGQAGDAAGAQRLHSAAVAQVPNAINARISLLVSLQLGGRFAEMIPHARWVADAAPDDPRALRFGIQSGVWGGDLDLAEQAYAKLLKADPRQAQAARRFIDNAPPPPPRQQ